MTRAPVHPRAAVIAVRGAALALALARAGPARADRGETTLALRPTAGMALLGETGTDERATVRSLGLAASASLGVRDWLDLGAELVASNFDEASYAWATMPIAADPLSGPLRRTTNIRQLRGTATLRLGILWVPFVQLALGLGARFRSEALLYVPTTQGDRWLVTDASREVTLDVVAGARAGLERRLTIHWAASVSAAVAQSIGVFRPDVRTSDVTLSLSYSWYPLLAP
jgi:hypothetical protein